MKHFEQGKIYRTSGPDIKFQVIRRTAQYITISRGGQPSRKKIQHMRLFDGCEFVTIPWIGGNLFLVADQEA